MTNNVLSVAIQGHEGSYHDLAAANYFGDSYDPRYLNTFTEVFDAVATGAADRGLTAVENSIMGSIVPVYDLLRDTGNICVTGEVYLGIHHSLLAMPGTKIEDIEEVYSHPAAIAQCSHFLAQQLPDAATHTGMDTAASAAYVRGQGLTSAAAIAGANNAERLGLQILGRDIEDNPTNRTRFLVLSRQEDDTPEQRAEANKTSLLIERLTDDHDELAPGTLYKTLGCFATAEVGLTRIESRPRPGDPWRYEFYVDCAAGALDPRMRAALQDLGDIGAKWRELGTYKNGEMV